jgi:hypothetical protein
MNPSQKPLDAFEHVLYSFPPMNTFTRHSIRIR